MGNKRLYEPALLEADSLGEEGIRGISEGKDGSRSSQRGYVNAMVPRLGLWEGRTEIYQGKVEVQWHRPGSFPLDHSDLETISPR